MTKGISTLLAVLIVLAGFTNDSQAAALPGDAGGCNALRDAVTEQVHHAGTLGRNGVTMFIQPWKYFVCDKPAQAVSAGFSAAMARMNVYLEWQSPWDQQGDMCLGVHLSECYPRRHSMVPFEPGDSAMVRDAWYSVQRAFDAVVGGHGTSGTARIDAELLSSTISRELSRNLRVGRQQVYYLH